MGAQAASLLLSLSSLSPSSFARTMGTIIMASSHNPGTASVIQGDTGCEIQMNHQGLHVVVIIIIVVITSAQLMKEGVGPSDRPAVIGDQGEAWLASLRPLSGAGSTRRAAESRHAPSTRRAEGPQLRMQHRLGEGPFRGLGRWLWDHKATWSLLLAPRLCQD